jgi:hypothetical protein
MLRQYEYGGYKTIKREEASGLNDFWSDAWGGVKSVVGDVVDEIADAIGINTDDPYYQAGKDIGLNIAADAISSDKSADEKKANIDYHKKQAEMILSQYKNMECDKMSDKQKQDVASTLAQYSAMFSTFGLDKEFESLIKTFNIPTNCALPTKDSKQVLVPAVVGVGTSGVAYVALGKVFASQTVRILSSLAAGGIAGGCTYHYVNKEKVA